MRTAGTSGFSPTDIATTVVFTDASLTSVAAKAVHITELRSALDQARETLVQPPVTYGALSTIRAADVLELRAGTQ